MSLSCMNTQGQILSYKNGEIPPKGYYLETEHSGTHVSYLSHRNRWSAHTVGWQKKINIFLLETTGQQTLGCSESCDVYETLSLFQLAKPS